MPQTSKTGQKAKNIVDHINSFLGDTFSIQTLLVMAIFFAALFFMLAVMVGLGSYYRFAFALIAFVAVFVVSVPVSKFIGAATHSFFGTGGKVDQESLAVGSITDKATAAMRSGLHERAIDYHTMLVENPANTTPEKNAYMIGQIYEDHLFGLRDALYWYRRAIALAYKNGTASKGIYAKEANERIKAIEDLLEDTRTDVTDLLLIAKKSIEQKDFEQAETQLVRLEKIFPNNTEINYLFGHLFLFRSNLGMAIEHFRRSIEKDPGHLLSRYFLACALHDYERLLEAREAIDLYLEAAGDNPEEAPRIQDARERLEEIDQQMEVFATEGEFMTRN